MRDKIQPIIDELEWLLEVATQEENYEFCEVLKDQIEDFNKYMTGDLEYSDIQIDVLELCIARYEIIKMTIVNENKYVLFSSFGNWLLFWVDDIFWEEIKEAKVKQDEMVMQQILDFEKTAIREKD